MHIRVEVEATDFHDVSVAIEAEQLIGDTYSDGEVWADEDSLAAWRAARMAGAEAEAA